tara:strand:+ start:55 stop:768 length:714 start_codon:yes stop_codon:yes gene_type:complete
MKYLILNFALLFSLQSFAQFTFINYDFTVPMDQQEVFMNTMNEFFTSKTGKEMPMAALSMHTFGYDKNFTHSMTMWHPDPKMVNKMVDPTLMMGNEDFQKVMMTFSKIGFKPSQSVTGRELISSEQVEGNTFQTLWFINVEDPQATATAFSKLVEDSKDILKKTNSRLALGQLLSGQQLGESHYVLGTFKDYATFVEATDLMYSSEGFANWSKSTAANSLVRVDSRIIMNIWNMPTE